MSAQKTQNVQDLFLNHLRKHKTQVTVYLVSGAKMRGIITWFDNFSLLLRRDAHAQLVYKRTISPTDVRSPPENGHSSYRQQRDKICRKATVATVVPRWNED